MTAICLTNLIDQFCAPNTNRDNLLKKVKI